MTQLIWLVTGCSSGLGEQLVLSILNRGDRVIATARGPIERLEHLQQLGAATLDLDVCASQANLNKKMQEALEIYGHVDVLVNNAAYIEAGLLEDITPERLLASFNTNLFGAVNVTRALLPSFRQKQAGTLVFMGSVGGWQGEVGAGPYCATKFAMEGVVECLQKETGFFGIRSIIFEPGYHRTKIMHADNVKLLPLTVPEYAEIHDAMEAGVRGLSGNQPGDPQKAAERIVDVIRHEGMAAGKEMPARLPLGADGMQQVREKCLATLKILEEWEPLIMSTGL